MAYRSTSVVRFVAAEPEVIWPLVSDPRWISAAGDHPVTVEPDAGSSTALTAVGDSWVEVHGEECDNDRVRWRVVASEAPGLIRIAGSQRGVRQVAEYKIVSTPGGALVKERIVFSPSFAGRPGQQVLPWLLLGTGLLAKFASGMNDIFDSLDKAVAAPKG